MQVIFNVQSKYTLRGSIVLLPTEMLVNAVLLSIFLFITGHIAIASSNMLIVCFCAVLFVILKVLNFEKEQ